MSEFTTELGLWEEVGRLRESRDSEARRAGAAEHEVGRLRAELAKVADRQRKDLDVERQRAELAETMIARVLKLCILPKSVVMPSIDARHDARHDDALVHVHLILRALGGE